MDKLWIVVCNHTNARIFERTRPRRIRPGRSRPGLERVDTLLHPQGRLHTGDLVSDRQGRVFGREFRRHGLSSTVSPTEHDAEQFAIEIAHRLDHGRTQGDFGRLIVVASPEMLGLLREHLSGATRKTIVASLDKNVAGMGDRELAPYLSPHIGEAERDVRLYGT